MAFQLYDSYIACSFFFPFLIFTIFFTLHVYTKPQDPGNAVQQLPVCDVKCFEIPFYENYM